MTTHRITWREGQAQSGYFAEVESETLADAAWFVATTIARTAPDGSHAAPVLVDAAEIDPESGKPVRPETAPQ